MSKMEILLIVLAACLFVALVVAFVFPYLKRKGVDVAAVLAQSQDMLATLFKTLDILKPFVDASKTEVIDKILKAADTGVGSAEQLYKIGQLPAEERNAAAKKYVETALALWGIEVTSDVARLVDGAIESKVFSLERGGAK